MTARELRSAALKAVILSKVKRSRKERSDGIASKRTHEDAASVKDVLDGIASKRYRVSCERQNLRRPYII